MAHMTYSGAFNHPRSESATKLIVSLGVSRCWVDFEIDPTTKSKATQ